MDRPIYKSNHSAIFIHEINGNPVVYIGDLAWDSHTSERCFASLNTPYKYKAKLNSCNLGDPIKNIPTCVHARIYSNYVELTISVGQDYVRQKFGFNTPPDETSSSPGRRQLSTSVALCDSTHLVPQNRVRYFANTGWGWLRYYAAQTIIPSLQMFNCLK